MITARDVVVLTDLTAAEVDAIASKGRVPKASAARLGSYLLHLYKGPHRVIEMICDDIRGALYADDLDLARQLYATLHRFLNDNRESLRAAR